MKKTTGITKEKAVRAVFAAVFVLFAVVCVFAGAGAGAATDNVIDLGNKDVWKLYTLDDFRDESGNLFTKEELLAAEWEDSFGNIVRFRDQSSPDGFFLAGDDIVEGTYYYTKKQTKEVCKISVKYPGAAAITGSIMKNDVPIGDLAGANVDVEQFTIQLDGFETGADTSIAWTNPDGSLTTTNPKDHFGIAVSSTGAVTFKTGDIVNVKSLGEYTIQKVIAKKVGTEYAKIAPFPLLGAPTTFTLYDTDDHITLTALADEIIQGNMVSVVLEAPYNEYTGTDGTGYYIKVENGTFPVGQVDVTNDGDNTAWISVGLDGVAFFVVKSENADDIKITAYNHKAPADQKSYATLTIRVVPGKIFAEAVPAITNIGNETHIFGTNELGGELALFMKGENYFKQIVAGGAATGQVAALNKTITGKEFEVTLKTGNLRADAGYYTLYLAKLTDTGTISGTDDFADKEKCSAYTTISIKLVPSFISITEMPAYAVIGKEFTISGVAEGHPAEVMWYAFGTNFFKTGTAPVRDDNTYRISFYPQHNEMSAGQYILVIQHPMYDGKFNVGPKGNAIYQNRNGSFMDGDATLLFTVDLRQTTNAAYALCRAIDDNEDIDDMYVKTSFTVDDGSLIIIPIPEKISQGETLTISGRAAGYQGGVATVNLLDSTGATVRSMEATVQEDGTWETDCGTASLACGDYTVSVYLGSLDPATAEISIVKGPVTQITYKLTDPEVVSGGPLQIIGKETVVHYPAALNQDDTEFKRGESVKATLQVHIPQGTFMNMRDNIYLDTDLTGASWAVSLHLWNTKMWEKQLEYPYNYISGFDVIYPGDIDLYITLTGYVPAGNKDKISVMKVSTTATGGNGVKSYNVLMNNSIPHADLTLQNGWNFISVPKKLAAENDTAGELFAGVNTGGKAPLSYNAQTKQWEQVTSSTVISPLNAYWIFSTEKLTLNPAFGTEPSVPAVKNVYTGWNAVGASAENPITAKAAFTGVNWRSYTLWNGDTQTYGTIYIKDGTGQYSDEQYVPLYKGGWLYMDGNGTINGYA